MQVAEELGDEGVGWELRSGQAWLELQRGRLNVALQLYEELRKRGEGDAARVASAGVGVARVLERAGSFDLAFKALVKVGEWIEDGASAGYSLLTRASMVGAEGRGREARLAFGDAARALGEVGDVWGRGEALLERGECALAAGDVEGARRDAERYESLEHPEGLELRYELLLARLGPSEDAELLVEELWDRASGCPLPLRSAVAVELAQVRLRLGDRAGAVEVLEGPLRSWGTERDALSGPLKEGLQRSVWVRDALALLRGLPDDPEAVDVLRTWESASA